MIVHRDIKPKNIFINGSSVVIGDLGLARYIKDERILSSIYIAGTCNYLSPEAIHKKKILHESDIWSFGCVLYELVTFKKAFDGPSEYGIMREIVEGELPKLEHQFFNFILKK